MGDKDMALLQLYTLGKAKGRNLLMEFLEQAGLENFAQATAGQMLAFYDACTEGKKP